MSGRFHPEPAGTGGRRPAGCSGLVLLIAALFFGCGSGGSQSLDTTSDAAIVLDSQSSDGVGADGQADTGVASLDAADSGGADLTAADALGDLSVSDLGADGSDALEGDLADGAALGDSTPSDAETPDDADQQTPEDTNGADQTADSGPTVDPNAPGWRLTFADEFDGPKTPGDPCYDNTQTKPMCLNRYWSREQCPDTVLENVKLLNKCVWSIYHIYNWMDWGKPWGYGFTALDPHEVKVQNGELILTSRHVSPSGNDYDCGGDLPNYLITKDCPIRSGAVMSRKWDGTAGFQQQYGRFEVRAILPAGPGSWPAHWLLPQEGPWPEAGEIDIMEAIWERPFEAHGSFHGGADEGTIRTGYSTHNYHDPGDDRFTTGWHVYAVEWDPQQIRFFIDDLEIGRVREGDQLPATIIESTPPGDEGKPAGLRSVDIPDLAFFFILNTSVVPTGGLQKNFSNFTTLTHRIDYVRVYERCLAKESDCDVTPPKSRRITNERWMSASKWNSSYRVTHRGDFNGDGKTDLLLQSSGVGHATYLLLADATPLHFKPEQDINDQYGMTQVLWSSQNRLLWVLDANGDGADDLLLQGKDANQDTLLLLADKTGGFQAVKTISTASGMTKSGWAANSVRMVRLRADNNGRTDLMLLDASGNARLLIANPDGTFQNVQTVTSSWGMSADAWSTAKRFAVVGDFNGDGQSDLLLQPIVSTEKAWLLLSNGVGGYATALDVTDLYWMSSAKWSTEFRLAHVGDFNGDGYADLLLQSKGAGHSTYLLQGQQSGGFLHEETLDTLYGMQQTDWSTTTHRLAVIDANGDGIHDLLLQGKSAGDGVFLLLGQQGALFSGRQNIANESTLSAKLWAFDDQTMHVGDFDGDHKSEVLLQPANDTLHTYLLHLRR